MSTSILPNTAVEVNSLSSVRGSSERSFSNESVEIQPVRLPALPPPVSIDAHDDCINPVHRLDISSFQSAPVLTSTSVIDMEQSGHVPFDSTNSEEKADEINSNKNCIPTMINYPVEHDEHELVNALDGSPLSLFGYAMTGFIAGIGLSLISCLGVTCPGCHQASVNQQRAFAVEAFLGSVVNAVLVVLYFTVLTYGDQV